MVSVIEGFHCISNSLKFTLSSLSNGVFSIPSSIWNSLFCLYNLSLFVSPFLPRSCFSDTGISSKSSSSEKSSNKGESWSTSSLTLGGCGLIVSIVTGCGLMGSASIVWRGTGLTGSVTVSTAVLHVFSTALEERDGEEDDEGGGVRLVGGVPTVVDWTCEQFSIHFWRKCFFPGTMKNDWDYTQAYNIHVHVHVQCTVKPLIKDPPRKGQLLYKGHFQYAQNCTCNTISFFNLRKEDSLPTRDKMAGPKVSFTRRFHCTCTCTTLCPYNNGYLTTRDGQYI